MAASSSNNPSRAPPESCSKLEQHIFSLVATSLTVFLLISSSQLAEAKAATQAISNGQANSTQQLKQHQLHEREFVSPQARVQLDCHRDKTVIRVNFTRPFNGVLGAGQPESTKCKLLGTGQLYYELQVSHNATDDCGAKWDSSTSSIANTLFIRFHQSLETGADISKNVLCRLSVGDLIVGRRPSQSSGARAKQQQRIIKAKRNQ